MLLSCFYRLSVTASVPTSTPGLDIDVRIEDVLLISSRHVSRAAQHDQISTAVSPRIGIADVVSESDLEMCSLFDV